MILSNYHTHTNYCDGIDTIQQNVDAALAKGFHSLGFSGHGYVPFEGLFCGMRPESIAEYRSAVNGLKESYAGRLNIYTGLENDSVCMLPAGDYDYTIGSIHCLKCGDNYYSIDSYCAIAASTIEAEFGGDGLAYAVAYYDAVLEFVGEKSADILGHIDLVRRFNRVNKCSDAFSFFDEGSADYRNAASAALERAVRAGYIIEVNTAPILKGFSDEPYPARFLLEIAREMDARIIVNSDAHYAKNLDYAFDKAEKLLRELGYKERWELTPEGFEPIRIT